MTTTVSEGASPGRMVRIQEPKDCQVSLGSIAESICRSPPSDEPELDVAMVGGDVSPDGVSVSIGFAVYVLVSADAPRWRHGRHTEVIAIGADPAIQRSTTPHRGYWQISYTRQTKSRTEYVRQQSVKEIRRQVATHKRFKRLIDEWIDLSIEHSRLTMQIAGPGATR
jgi:hypothetical protein